ncbi:GNAT family N-acetyltransferase [Microvirga sp. BT689]|uniref:GNAT family N-acetyltransferase n=1 Tax=Microvirga arvi TaxID=2778731 RepID=UPI00194FCD13|nr:GNAT family N-acetyltransferase [Microvirga arvi]MBM6583877.1 GNAT family N-acetyltransferase [Microvirga arvi]
MLIGAEDTDFATLLDGKAPRGLQLPDSEIAPRAALRMLRELAARIRPQFAPAAWWIVESGELVGLCSLTRLPIADAIDIGYGIAPSRQGRGHASGAIAHIVEWACSDPRVTAVTAETSVHNHPSQRVLERNGFLRIGERMDPEDGELICWRRLTVRIRPERPEDVDTIHNLTTAAFKHMPYSSQTEAAIVDALRRADALTVSLVATKDGAIVGHVAFSPVTINGEENGWYGLGPVSIWPVEQWKGIGHALIREGLSRLMDLNAEGCVVLGSPSYYSRFGFVSDPELRYGDVPPEHFQRLCFTDIVPKGEVAFHPGFHVA